AAHDIDGYGRWLRAFVAALELPAGGRVVLLGHSFGSIVVAGSLAGSLAGSAVESPAAGEGGRPDAVVLVNPIGQPALA
ncbi:hypothetical protein SB767_35920, partial [Bacillus sp. SIMBA_069]